MYLPTEIASYAVGDAHRTYTLPLFSQISMIIANRAATEHFSTLMNNHRNWRRLKLPYHLTAPMLIVDNRDPIWQFKRTLRQRAPHDHDDAPSQAGRL